MPQKINTALILAAGCGTRLSPYTDSIPKCLLLVNKKPILEYQIRALLKNNIKNIIIVTGYRQERIEKFINNKLKKNNIKIVNNADYQNTNNMYSFYLARTEIFNKNCITVNGDVIFDSKILTDLINSTYKNSIAVDAGKYDKESMKIELKKQLITDLSKKIPKNKAYGNSIDLYKFSAKGINLLLEEMEKIIERQQDKNQWTEVAMQNLLKSEKLKMHPMDIQNKLWMEIDNLTDLAIAETKFNNSIKKLASKKAFFFDLDGTLYLGNKLLPKVKNFLQYLEKENKKNFFLSNNSSESTEDYCKRLQKRLKMAIQKKQIILSTHLTIKHLKEKNIKKIFVLGTKSLMQELTEQGFEILYDEKYQPEAVIVAFDKTLTYNKLKKACFFLQKEINFIATHPDKFCPTNKGGIPDAGAITALLEHSTGKKALVLGKPCQEMITNKLKQENIPANDAIIIGDRLHTDIKMGQNAGIDTVLVLSGETNWEDMVYGKQNKSSFIFQDINHLFTTIQQYEKSLNLRTR